MFCKNCGNSLSEKAKFCSKCGNTVKREETEESKETFADALDSVVEKENETPAVTISEMEAENSSQEITEIVEEKQEEIVSEEKEPETQTALVTTPESTGIYEKEEAPVKKSKKGIIIGASAAVLVAGAAAVGYFCFSNEIMHLFMGDAGFGVMLEEKSITYLRGGNEEINDIDAVMAEYVGQALNGEEGEEADLTKSLLDQVLSVYGDSTVDINVGIDPGMILSLADSEDVLSKFKLNFSAEAVQGEECDRVSYIYNEGGNRILGADLYLSEEDLLMLIPELTSETFIVETEDTSEEEKQKVEFSAQEMKRIRENVQKIYNKNLKNADFEYTKGGTDLVVAGCAIDSERVIIRLTEEDLDIMFGEMRDFLKNDEYLRNYYVEATGGDISEYEKMFEDSSSEDESESVSAITIETYFTDHAEVTGKKILITETEVDTGESFDMSFETTLGNCDFSIGDKDVTVALSQRKTDDTSGKMEITVRGEELGAALVLDVEYSDVGVAEYKGQPVNTGTYVLKLSDKDELIDYIIEDASSDEDYDDMMMTDASDAVGDIASSVEMLRDIKIESSVTCDGTSVKSSLKIEFPLIMDLIFSAEVKPLETDKPVMPDSSNAIVVNEDFDMEDNEALQQEIYENLIALSEKSELLGMLIEYLESM